MSRERQPLPQDREVLFAKAKEQLREEIDVYQLGRRFKELPPGLSDIVMLDVTKVPGCHYGLRNVFVPIIEQLEKDRLVKIDGQEAPVRISPETTVLVEPSTGNGWVAFSDAATMLGYEHCVIMPGGLPEARYRHPQGRDVQIIKTPAELYAEGMPLQLKKMIEENPKRLASGEKIYCSPNHAIRAADITVQAMSALGEDLLAKVGDYPGPLRVVASMGNGASICALGESVKKGKSGSKIIATETFQYGVGYDRYAKIHNILSYRDLYDIDPGDPRLMKTFTAFGTNAPLGVDLPLQRRAIEGGLLDGYNLFTDDRTVAEFEAICNSPVYRARVRNLPNINRLPQALYDTYGNSTLGNIAAAARCKRRGGLIVAMAYDGRENYK